MKKAFKIFGIILVLLIATVIAAPLLLKDKFADIIKEQINQNVNAKVDFSDIDISILSTFPKAGLVIENLSITNYAPFEGDTLAYAKEITLKLPLNDVLASSEERIPIDAFTIDTAIVNIISNKDGITNYDIALQDDTPTEDLQTEDNSNGGISLSVQEYSITNANINYIDEASELHTSLTDLNHSGSGDLSAALSSLKTNTTSNISVSMGKANYLNNNTLALKADLEIDQENQKYSFLDNAFTLNQLKLVFDGFAKLNDNNTQVDVKFNTPTSDFKNFLALLPAEYSKDISKVQTNGSFTINGQAQGVIDSTTIPKFNVSVTSKNASFKYPDLPKSVENINLNVAMANTTGQPDDTYVDLQKLSLQIDQDKFSANGKVSNLLDNMFVDMHLDGTLNLGNISQAYPIQLEQDLNGILNAKLHTAFSQNAIETSNYEQMKNNGGFSITDFKFASKDIVNPIEISEASVAFTPKRIALEKLDMKSGESDINAVGTIDNLLGFLFSNKTLKGDFKVNSNLFNVNDFMVDNTTEEDNEQKESETGDGLKIPAFLDAKISANAKKVIYDNLTLNNVTGNLVIKDETVALNNMTTEMFDGRMSIDGDISTKNDTPKFNLDLGIDQFDISKSFKGMDLLTSIAPIAKMLQGKLNTKLNLKGNLDDEFSPDLNTLTGNALAELLTKKINTENSTTLTKLNDQISFIDLNKLNLKDLKTALSFEDGKVAINPFTVKYEDINIEIGGSHGFNNNMAYTATFDVPAKYFGKDVGGLLSKLSDDDIKNVTVPLVATIGGTVTKPQVKTDMKQSIANLTKQLIQIQKDKLIEQGTGALGNVLGGVLGGNNNNSNTNNTPKDTPKDSTSTSDPVKDGIKNVLGGLFGKKKKDTID
ncbi:MAG: AsmA-like C-terminal region-containing protein [Flavobacteriaceae bacterium]